MKELKDYTEEELRNELKRRAVEKRKHTPREIVYIEFEATVKSIDNIQFTDWNGKVKYKPFVFWKFKVKDWTTPVNIKYYDEFYLKQGCFKRDNAPKVGERVKLKYIRRNGYFEISNIRNAKIIEIVK